MAGFEWSDEMHQFCRENRSLPRAELTDRFNDRFGTDRSADCIRSFCKRHRYMTGRTGHFEKGLTPHNKGIKGWSPFGTGETYFRKGHLPQNTLPVGSRKKTKPRYDSTGKKVDPGYWITKTADPKTWEYDHRMLWEKHRGSIPDGHMLMFVDGDQDNIVIDNLCLLTRAEFAVFNRLISLCGSVDADIRRSLIAIARVKAAISDAILPDGDLQIAKRNGLSRPTVMARLNNGWPKSEAITVPAGARRSHAQT